MKIFLDDIRFTPKKYDLTFKDGESLLIWLKSHPTTKIDLLSFDHDLGENKLNGAQVINKIAMLPNNIINVQIHSSNNVGRNNMYKALLSYKKHGYLPNLKNIDSTVYEVIDGIETPSPWYKMR